MLHFKYFIAMILIQLADHPYSVTKFCFNVFKIQEAVLYASGHSVMNVVKNLEMAKD